MSELITPGQPIAGFYKSKLVRGGPWVAVRIWFGPPADPITGEELDRSHRWQAEIDGKLARQVWDAWPYCAGQPIDEAEYRYLTAMKRHAVTYEPEMPEASPRRPVDFNKLKFDF